MRTPALLIPALLAFQASRAALGQTAGPGWHANLEALAVKGDARDVFRVQYQGETFKGFDGPPTSRMAREGRFTLGKTGNTVYLKDEKGASLGTWTLPMAVQRGHENPAKPGSLEAWLRPDRVSALLDPAQALSGWLRKAEWKETLEDVNSGQVVQVFVYAFQTPYPKEYDTRALDTGATLRVWVGPRGLPLKAEVQTGYRGRFGNFHPFGRSTTLRWGFEVKAGHLTTATYDLNETHYDDWDRTKTLLALQAEH